MTHASFRLLLLVAVPLLLSFASAPVAAVIESVDRYRVVPVGTFVLALTLVLVAGGVVTYVAVSLALEVHRGEQRRSNDVEDAIAESRRRTRRRGRTVRHDQVVGAVRDGAVTVEEVADLLDLHLHVARARLEELVDRERLAVRDGRYVAPQPKAGATSRAPHWIDVVGK